MVLYLYYRPLQEKEVSINSMARLIRYLEDGVWRYASVKDVGSLELLKTLAKGDLVSAINELYQTGGATVASKIETLETTTSDVTSRTSALETEVDDVKNNIVYKVEIFSTNGNVFKSGQISTVLHARVFHGSTEVTDTFNASRFKWERVSNDTAGDIAWNTSHAGGTKSITVTHEDIKVRATFNCTLLDA